MKKKILIGIESSGGGAFKHVIYLATKLPKEVFEITLMYSAKRNEDISRELEILRGSEIKLVQFSLSKQLNFINDLKAFFFISNLISKEKFEIIHAHSSKAGLIFRLAGYSKKVSKIYYTPHCFHFQSKKGISKKVSVVYERLMSKITAKIITSDKEFERAIEHKIAKKEKFEVINNAVPFDELKLEKKISEIREEFKISNDIDFIVAGVGRLEPQKDWGTYIKVANEVIKKIPNAIFLLVGEGSQKEYLRDLIKEYKLSEHIILTGYIKNINKIYNIIDVLVSTSLWEGLPYVVLEASQYHKPIVATNAISEEIAFYKKSCNTRDYICLSNQIFEIAKLRKENCKLTCQNIDFDKFSFQNFLNNHIQLYS